MERLNLTFDEGTSAALAGRVYMADLRAPRSTLPEPRVANASMVMTYDRSRIVGERAGRVHPEAMRAIDDALALHVALADAER